MLAVSNARCVLQDPDNGNALTSVPLLANGPNPETFTINRNSTGPFRLTIFIASGDGANVTHTTTVNGVSATQTAAHTANGLHYFVVSATNNAGERGDSAEVFITLPSAGMVLIIR